MTHSYKIPPQTLHSKQRINSELKRHFIITLILIWVFVFIFNARAQRSWRRRLWHRPRTPSSSPSSWRLQQVQRWDTIKVRITKFGSEVELDEICFHTKFDVTGYFCSPAIGHYVNYFSISRCNISGKAKNKCTKFEQAIELNTFYTSPPNFMVLALRSSV